MDEEIINKVKTLAELAKEFLKFDKVIIFGSYANGKFNQESDIDVAFIVDHILENHFKLSAKLFELVYYIDARIEPVIIGRENDRSGFFDSIIKNGKEVVLN